MTDFDKELIAQAESLSRYDYWQIDDMIKLAQTDETREILYNLRWGLYDLMLETH